jgi:tight adherence protein C
VNESLIISTRTNSRVHIRFTSDFIARLLAVSLMPDSSTEPTRPVSASKAPVSRAIPSVARNATDTGRADTPFERVLRQAMERRTKQASFGNRVLRPTFQSLADKSIALMANVDQDAIRFRLMQAGFPAGLRARDFFFLKLVLMIAVPLILMIDIPLLMLVSGLEISWLTGLWILLPGIWLGFRGPDIWLAVLTKRRQFEIQLALPDMIDLITISVEAGLGLYAAIQRVSQRFSNPLSEEFLRSLQEVRLGRTNAEAMRDLMKRANVDDLTMFISSLIQAETLGVPIASVLRRLRDKRRQRAREQAQKAPLKMLFPLAIFIFPALFVVILGPAILKFMDTKF